MKKDFDLTKFNNFVQFFNPELVEMYNRYNSADEKIGDKYICLKTFASYSGGLAHKDEIFYLTDIKFVDWSLQNHCVAFDYILTALSTGKQIHVITINAIDDEEHAKNMKYETAQYVCLFYKYFKKIDK